MQRPTLAMSQRELLAELLVDGGFVARRRRAHCSAPAPRVRSVAGVCCASCCWRLPRGSKFDTPFGFTVATQLAFVPLLFALPVPLVPIAVVCGLMLASLPDLRDGSMRPSRLVKRIGNAWFAIGPVAVFVLADTAPSHAGPLAAAGRAGGTVRGSTSWSPLCASAISDARHCGSTARAAGST